MLPCSLLYTSPQTLTPDPGTGKVSVIKLTQQQQQQQQQQHQQQQQQQAGGEPPPGSQKQFKTLRQLLNSASARVPPLQRSLSCGPAPGPAPPPPSLLYTSPQAT